MKASVYRLSGRKFYYMEFRDPQTGDKVVRSTKQKTRREAERAAGKLLEAIKDGRDIRDGNMRWDDFRERYETEVLESLAEQTIKKVDGVFNVFERTARPTKLSSINADLLSRYQKKLRQAGRSETTIKGHLAHVMAAIRWAVDQGWLRQEPKIKKPKRANRSKIMKGRPITTEEFERMLAMVPRIVAVGHVAESRKPALVASWEFYLHGLWLSGLRLDESMHLHWSDVSTFCVLDVDQQHPMFIVRAEVEKGNQDRILPMAPEFAEFLREVPKSQRQGFVFNPLPRRPRHGDRLKTPQIGRTVCAMGREAGIKVDESGGKVKYASAHDFRRAFGERWATRVMPAVLQELMRHESIETTMRYYVGKNARRTASVLWDEHQKATYTSTYTSGSERDEDSQTPCF